MKASWFLSDNFGRLYTCPANHSLSFANALERCEIWFLSALDISAYVLPSYSNIGSQPKRGVSGAVLAGTILPWCISVSESHFDVGRETNVSPALEDFGLLARAVTKSEGTDCLSRFIWVCYEKVVQAFMAKTLEEPLARSHYEQSIGESDKKSPHMYGPGNSFKALKHKQVSSTRTGPLICSTNQN